MTVLTQTHSSKSEPIIKETSMPVSNTNMTVANIVTDKRLFSS